MYIAYDIKNGIEYAKLCVSTRDGGDVLKNYTNLGRVLDKELGIYRNRERGVFTYDPATNAYGKAPAEFVPPSADRKESLILDFGDVFFLDRFMRTRGLCAAVDATGYGNPDTLYAMICYYAVCSMANCHAQSWWEGSYARILYPKANLSSQRISDFLTAIGDEYSQREFFKEYFKMLDQSGSDTGNVLIDSTGLPNSIHFPLTAISNHNGEISNEVRLIYVVQQKTGLPLYFRYCPGNVIDTTTLTRCLEELKAQGINVKFAVLDAGYYTEDNIRELFENRISFVTRLKGNLVIYRDLVEEHLHSLESRENLVEYNGRYVYLKCVPIRLHGHNAYAYVGLDIERKSSESRKTFRRAKDRKMDAGQVFDTIAGQGVFIIVSSRRIATAGLLPLYYTRQQIEQVFDIGKNYADMLPLRVQTEETFRGHLLLTFIVTVVLKQLQDALLKTTFNPISLFMNLRNQKCKVFSGKIVSHETFRKANDIYRLFKIKCPAVIATKSQLGLWLEFMIGNYSLRKELAANDDPRQAHHLNQDAAFKGVIPKNDGMAVALDGNAFTDPGTPHYEAHKSLEEFWEPYRKGGEFYETTPTVEQYNNALKNSLIVTGMSESQAIYLVGVARQQQQNYGLYGSDGVPRVPGRISQVKP
jgi:hypothetical protein